MGRSFPEGHQIDKAKNARFNRGLAIVLVLFIIGEIAYAGITKGAATAANLTIALVGTLLLCFGLNKIFKLY